MGSTRTGQLLPSRKLRPWAESLSYAMTDRRLLILEGEVITDSYTPDLLRVEPQLLIRGPDHGDVLFEKGEIEKTFPTAPDRSLIKDSFDKAIANEQNTKAFKALPDAESVMRRLEDWIQTHRARAEKSLQNFLERRSPDEETCRRIENPRLGLTMLLPAVMRIRVRKRSLPTGKSGMDLMNWTELGASADWNTLEARLPPPSDLSIEITVEETPAVRRVKKLTGGIQGLIFRLLGGKILEVDEDVIRDEFSGFSVTRRLLQRGEGTPQLRRDLVLHDGRRQLSIVTEWEESSRLQESVLAAIVDSLKLEH